jgi:hypothetical protein
MASLRDDEDMLRIDMERASQEGRLPDPSALMEGDPLEADLMASGFYGEGQAEGDVRLGVIALGNLLSELRHDCVDQRWAHDQNTLLNFAFKNGHHYVEADRSRRGVVPVPAPRGLVRRTVDKFAPWYRNQHGKLAQGMPQAQAVAKSNTTENKDAAEFAEELVEWVVPMAWGHRKRSELGMWQLLSGVPVMYCGVEYTADEEYFEATGGEGGGMMHRPDLVHQIHSPLEIWTDNKTPSIADMRWVGRDLYLPIAEARALFLDRDDQQRIVPVQDDSFERGYHTLREVQRMLGMAEPWGRAGARHGISVIDEEDDAVVAEWWGREGLVMQGQHFDKLAMVEELDVEVLDDGSMGGLPLVRFPRGIRVAFTPEGWILEIANNHHGHLPFREVKVSQSAGFYTPAWATPMRELNMAINWMVSLREQHTRRTANPTLLEPTDADVHRRAGIMGTIQRIVYKANRFGVKPEWMNPPTMPADAVQFMQELERLWQDISGIHEVSQARLPARLSGVAVALLQEQDVAQLGFAGQELEDAFTDIMKMTLVNIQKFFPDNDPRLVRLAGDAMFRLRAFMLADLEDDLSVQVRPGSAIPRSPAAVKAEARELFEIGALVDDLGRPDTRKLLEAYGHASRDELYFEDDVDRSNAREEEDLILALPEEQAMLIIQIAMQTGEMPPPFNPKVVDNDLVHDRSHRVRLKRIIYDPRISEINKQLLELHWMLHVERALPLMMETAPEVVMALMGGQQGEEEGGDGEAEGDESNQEE